MYKVEEKEINNVLDQCADNIAEMIKDYKYTNKLETCVPVIDVFPIAEEGFFALFKSDDDAMGSIVVINDECIFTSYGKDSDVMH